MTDKKQIRKVLTLNSSTETGELQENQEVETFLLEKSQELGDKVFLLVYKYHQVVIGKINNGSLQIENPDELTIEYLKELRMFSTAGELYLWNQGCKFKYRLRLDNRGDSAEIYDEEHLMWGTGLLDDKQTVVETSRGPQVRFSFPLDEISTPLKYQVRNYLDYDDNGQIRFYDARLVGFVDANGKEL